MQFVYLIFLLGTSLFYKVRLRELKWGVGSVRYDVPVDKDEGNSSRSFDGVCNSICRRFDFVIYM